MSKQVDIKAVPSLNPRICRFEVSTPLLPFGELHFKRNQFEQGPSLVRALLSIQEIEEVRVLTNSLTVSRSSEGSWKSIAQAVGAAIRQNLEKTSSEIQEEEQSSSDDIGSTSDMAIRIQRILEEKINPSIASHGGRIQFVEYKDRRAYITMQGGCQGCSMSKITLKSGVEKTLREDIPQLLEVVDITDHSLGVNPYHN